jgi:hypothetical protein
LLPRVVTSQKPETVCSEGYSTGEQEKKGKSFFIDWTFFFLLWRVIIPWFINIIILLVIIIALANLVFVVFSG